MKSFLLTLFLATIVLFPSVSKAEETPFPYNPASPNRGSKLLLSSAEREVQKACQEEKAGIEKQIRNGYLPPGYVCNSVWIEKKIIEDMEQDCINNGNCPADVSLHVGLWMTFAAVMIRLEILD